MTNDGWSTKPTYTATTCRHREVVFQHKNISFLDNTLHYLEIFGWCNNCKKHVTFVGIPSGRQDFSPSMTEDGIMVRLPFVCEGDKLKI